MKNMLRNITIGLFIAIVVLAVAMPVYAAVSDQGGADAAVQVTETASADNSVGNKALAAGIAIGLAACGGAIGMGLSIAKSSEGISRQPEAEGKIRTTLMLGLVFVETAIIYALIIAILIIFVM